jgi:PRTRC genetic system protein E
MSFFKSIEQHLEGLNLNVVISKNDNGLTVSVLPRPTCKDEAMKSLAPILLKGTAEELDAQFAGIIQQPLQKVSGISTNLIQFEKNVEVQKEKTAIVKAKKEADKKITDKADKYIKEAEDFIEKDDTKKAILKAKTALKIAPEYKKAIDLMNKLEPKEEGMFVTKEEAKVVEQVKEEIAEVVMASEPTIAEKPLVDLSHIPNTLAEKTPVILGAESKEEVDQVQNALAEAGLAAPTSMKEVAMEEQQKQTLPPNSLQKVDPSTGDNIGEPVVVEAPIEKVVVVAPAVAPANPVVVSEPVYNKVDANGKPTRQDMEPMESFEARLIAWVSQTATIPAATNPHTAPIVEEITPMQEMAEMDMVKREAEFEAERIAITPVVKAETPPASASDNIEILS